MSRIDELLKVYESFVSTRWREDLAGREKVWFCIYDPRDERRLRLQLPEFERVTRQAGHTWASVDLTNSFAEWLGRHDYREGYFAQPQAISPALDEFHEHLADSVRAVLSESPAASLVTIVGAGALFGLGSVSRLVEGVSGDIPGRLLVFFPGSRDGSNYRLLDARDGWNYLAVPIEVEA